MSKVKYILFLLAGAATLNSCVLHKDLTQFQNAQNDESVNVVYTPYILEQGDLISLRISSMDAESESVFNKEKGERSSGSYSEVGLYLNSYMIDKDGNISVPMIGDVKASGKSIQELQDSLFVRFEKYYRHFSMDVKLVNFKVAVLGEVRISGSFSVYREKLSVLDAIAMAKGFTTYANTEEVLLIRENTGSNEIIKLNFKDKELLASKYFYCRPGDVLYVNPTRAKSFKGNSPVLQMTISTLSLFLLLFYNIVR